MSSTPDRKGPDPDTPVLAGKADSAPPGVADWEGEDWSRVIAGWKKRPPNQTPSDAERRGWRDGPGLKAFHDAAGEQKRRYLRCLLVASATLLLQIAAVYGLAPEPFVRRVEAAAWKRRDEAPSDRTFSAWLLKTAERVARRSGSRTRKQLLDWVDEHADAIRNRAGRAGLHDGDDLVQEVARRVSRPGLAFDPRRRSRADPTRSTRDAFMWRIVTRVLLDLIRARDRTGPAHFVGLCRACGEGDHRAGRPDAQPTACFFCTVPAVYWAKYEGRRLAPDDRAAPPPREEAEHLELVVEALRRCPDGLRYLAELLFRKNGVHPDDWGVKERLEDLAARYRRDVGEISVPTLWRRLRRTAMVLRPWMGRHGLS